MTRRGQLSRRQISILNALFEARDAGKVQVLSGVRGCGKFFLLQQLHNALEVAGVCQENIVVINVEHLRFDTQNDGQQLMQAIESRLVKPEEHYYVLLNQICSISDWESILSVIARRYSVSYFLTASRADWCSERFCALFQDAYTEYQMYPMSLTEYIEFNSSIGSQPVRNVFSQYMQYGSMSLVNFMPMDDYILRTVTAGIYNTVLVNDLMRMSNIKDVPMFERLSQYMVRNIGVLGSPKSISDYFSSIGYKIASETVANYLAALENAYLVYRIQRYDILAGRELKNRSKYYIVDTGVRHALTGHYEDVGYELENTVFFELLRRGYQVQIGKIGKGEIDFVARIGGGAAEYYQVCRTISQHETFYSREYEPLLRAKDEGAKKVILSMDETFPESSDGIQFRNLISFLCEA